METKNLTKEIPVLKFDANAEKNFDAENAERDKQKEDEQPPVIDEEKVVPPVEIPVEFSLAILEKATSLLVLAHTPILKKTGLNASQFKFEKNEIETLNKLMGDTWLLKVFEVAQKYPIVTAIIYFEYCFFEKFAKLKAEQNKEI